MALREDVIRRADGSEGIYSYVEKPDFALTIPIERDGFHLEQYRYPVAHRSWEFPQGTLPNREDGDPAELQTGEHAREHEEQGMHRRWVSQTEFEQMIRDGLVTDDSNLAAYLLLLLQQKDPR
ncbi:MAG: ADP-ribose pyrophosphatase [Actinomycetota bacterium]|nr:ADP-ribose pyrophosphatase [Actinomycetota bacterium]